MNNHVGMTVFQGAYYLTKELLGFGFWQLSSTCDIIEEFSSLNKLQNKTNFVVIRIMKYIFELHNMLVAQKFHESGLFESKVLCACFHIVWNLLDCHLWKVIR